MPPIARCPTCHLIFPARGFIGGTARNVELHDNFITCPRCRGLAHIRNGVYDINEGIATFLAENVRDAATVRQLRARLAEVFEERTEDKVRRSLHSVAPELGKKTDSLSFADLISILALLLSVLQLIQPTLDQNHNKDVQLSPEQFQQLIDAASRR